MLTGAITVPPPNDLALKFDNGHKGEKPEKPWYSGKWWYIAGGIVAAGVATGLVIYYTTPGPKQVVCVDIAGCQME